MNDNAQMVIALYDYAAREASELSIKKNEKLLVLDDRDQWWKVQNDRAQEGLVPSTYVERKNSLKSKKKLIDKISASVSRKPQKDPPEMHYAVPQEAHRSNEANNSVESSALVKFPYQPVVEDELALQKGEKVVITRKNSDGWWYGTCHGRSGWLPSNYVIEETMEPYRQGVPGGKLSTSMASVICKVKTMYAFTSANEEELNFDEGQILDIIEQPADDPEWWKARTPEGHEGLVPITFVQIIPESVAKIESSVNNSPRTVMKTFTNEPWFFGTMTRDKTEESMMKNAKDGDFLVRGSETQGGDYAVSVKTPENIKHFRVLCRDGKYRIGQRTFNSMPELIEHYRKAPIVTIRSGQKMYLVEPFANPNGYYPRK